MIQSSPDSDAPDAADSQSPSGLEGFTTQHVIHNQPLAQVPELIKRELKAVTSAGKSTRRVYY